MSKTKSAQLPGDGDVLMWDTSGYVPSPVVINNLQGHPIAGGAPADGTLYAWVDTNGEWSHVLPADGVTFDGTNLVADGAGIAGDGLEVGASAHQVAVTAGEGISVDGSGVSVDVGAGLKINGNSLETDGITDDIVVGDGNNGTKTLSFSNGLLQSVS